MEKFPVLRPGSVSPFAAVMQLAMSRAGFSPGEKDGIFGAKTYRALLSFQKASGLAPDGVAGARTWDALTPYLTGYITHRTVRGDTFYALAKKYGTTVSALETANPQTVPENLRIGAEITVPLGFEVVPQDVPMLPELLTLCIRGLKARYPFITAGQAGRSVLGRPLHYLKIGYGEKEVFYNAAHHANEWITSPLLMLFAERLCAVYANGSVIGDESAEKLLSGASLYLMPMVDPDGVSLVTGGETDSAAYGRAVKISADYPFVPFPNGWKANVSGVDLNLQYPAGWEEARRIKFEAGWVSPAPRDFVGYSPLSAPESRAVYEFTRSHNFALTLSYHTQGGVIYWRYGDRTPEGSEKIALDFAKLSGYELADTPPESANAGYPDWFIEAYSRPGFTIEAGRGSNPLPLSVFPEIYRENEGILVRAMM